MRPAGVGPTRHGQLLIGLCVLPAVLLPAAFLLASVRANPAAGLPLDDSWIHIRYADNLARGYGLSLNRGVPVPGATSPLWVGVVAAAARAGVPVVGAGQILSIVLNALSAVAAYHLALRLVSARLAWFAAMLCGCSGVLAWSAGGALEVGLFNFLSLHAIRIHAGNTDRAWRPAVCGGIVLGLAIWARPEAVGLVVVLAIVAVWDIAARRPSTGCAAGALAKVAVQAALALAVAAPYAWFCAVTTGRPLPTTFYVKAGAPFSLAFVGQCAMQFVRTLGAESTLTAVLAALGAVVILGRAWSKPRQLGVVAWAAGLPIAYGVIGNTEAGANFGRHFYILVPSVMVLAVVGIRAIAHGAFRFGRSRPFRRHVAHGVLVVLVLDLLWHAVERGRQFVLNVKNVNEMQVAAAMWVRDHVPPRCTVAVNDIGAMSFFADRPVVDLRGIATPEILPFLAEYGRPAEPARDSGVLEFLKLARPDYLVLFPDWYPRTLSELLRGRVVRREAVFALKDNITCGGDALVVLKADWKGR